MTIPTIPSPPDCTIGSQLYLTAECGQTDPVWSVVPETGPGAGRVQSTGSGCGGKLCPIAEAVKKCKEYTPDQVLELAKALK